MSQASKEQLSPSQALANLNEVAQKYVGTRQDHILLEQSVQVLVNALNDLAQSKAKPATEAESAAEAE